MENDRTDTALRRIAAAVERIEKHNAAGQANPLERRYQTLRAEAGAALDQLDDLIARMER